MRRPVAGPAQIPRGGLPHRAEHRAERGEEPPPPPRPLDAPRAAALAAQTLSLGEPHPLRAARHGAHRLAVELSRATAAQPARRSHLGGLHRRAETLALHAARLGDAPRDDRRNLRRALRRRRRGQPRRQYAAAGPALGPRLLHGQPRAGADRHGRRGAAPHARHTGAGRQKPLHRGPRRRRGDRRAPHRMGQDPQCGADLHRPRLPAAPRIARRCVPRGLRPGAAAPARRRRPAKPPLRPAGGW